MFMYRCNVAFIKVLRWSPFELEIFIKRRGALIGFKMVRVMVRQQVNSNTKKNIAFRREAR